MEKAKYLREVADFVSWVRNRLDTDQLSHSYRNRLTQQDWRCTSLFDAFHKYTWPTADGNDYQSNALELTSLQQALKNGLDNNNSQLTCDAAIDVMKWGGVMPGNVRWLIANQQSLVQLLKETRDALNTGNLTNDLVNDRSLRFNSGMTKVYSLLCDNFIIYDSRVAAALGWIVVKYCVENKIRSVPPKLQFPWAPAKETTGQQNPKRRNPSQGNYIFPRLQSGPMHAQWNLKASWLLEAIIKDAHSEFKKQDNPLRALESALFMIGYDLAQNIADGATLTSELVNDDNYWDECVTLSRGRQFSYRITKDGIEVRNGSTFRDQELNNILGSLREQFGDCPFPLSNSATKVRNGEARPGLGSIYFEVTGRNPPDTSKLAAILEDLTIISPANPGAKTKLYWTLDREVCGLNSSSIWTEFLCKIEKASN